MKKMIRRKYINTQVEEYFKENCYKSVDGFLHLILDVNNEPFKDNCSSLERNIIEDDLFRPRAISCIINGVCQRHKNMIIKKELVDIDGIVYELIIGIVSVAHVGHDVKFIRLEFLGTITKEYSFSLEGVENRINNITNVSLELR